MVFFQNALAIVDHFIESNPNSVFELRFIHGDAFLYVFILLLVEFIYQNRSIYALAAVCMIKCNLSLLEVFKLLVFKLGTRFLITYSLTSNIKGTRNIGNLISVNYSSMYFDILIYSFVK